MWASVSLNNLALIIIWDNQAVECEVRWIEIMGLNEFEFSFSSIVGPISNLK